MTILNPKSKDYDIVMRYYDNHKHCPKCGSVTVESSISPPDPVPGQEYRDRKNKTYCANPDCHWYGVIDDLKR